MHYIFGMIYAGILIAILFWLVLVDIKMRKIPNKILLAILALALVNHLVERDLSAALAGGILAFLMFLLVYLANKKSIGAGDLKFGGVLGFVFGYPHVLYFLFAVGIVSLIAAAIVKLRKGGKIPYAPIMAAGAFLTLLVTF